MADLLLEGLQKIGLTEEEIADSKEKLIGYAKELQEGNDQYGLTKIIDWDEIIIRHLLDSLVAIPKIKELKEKIISSRENFDAKDFLIGDIGSGGGIPGIPLSSVLNDTKFILAERMTKRCAFLNHCKDTLNLDNVQVETIEAERIEQKRFDMIVFRAFRPLDKKMTRVLLRILKEDGILVAYKAKKDKILEEMEGIKQWIPEYEIIPLEVPFLDDYERNLVIVQKSI